MATVKLELLKKHVRADDFSSDDEYLAHLLSGVQMAEVPYTLQALVKPYRKLGV